MSSATSANLAGYLRKIPPKTPRPKSFPKDVADMAVLAGHFYVLKLTPPEPPKEPAVYRNSPETLPAKKFPKRPGRCGLLAECFYVFDRTGMYVTGTSHLYTYVAEHPYITHSLLSKKPKSAAVHFDSTGLGLVEVRICRALIPSDARLDYIANSH